MPRAKQRTPELRDRVLSVAVDVLVEDGMSGFTTRRVAERAGTSLPAVYELFTDKAGLVSAVVFEGFRRLGRALRLVPETGCPQTDLEQMMPVFRQFCLDYPALARVMFSRPFQDFDSDAMELSMLSISPTVREVLTDKVRQCVAEGLLVGDPTDIAHALLALAQGLAVQEGGRWLGMSTASRDRRWQVGVQALLRGFSPPA